MISFSILPTDFLSAEFVIDCKTFKVVASFSVYMTRVYIFVFGDTRNWDS